MREIGLSYPLELADALKRIRMFKSCKIQLMRYHYYISTTCKNDKCWLPSKRTYVKIMSTINVMGRNYQNNLLEAIKLNELLTFVVLGWIITVMHMFSLTEEKIKREHHQITRP